MVSNPRGTGTWTNVKFPPTRDLIRVKCPGVAQGKGGMGTLGFDLYITTKNSQQQHLPHIGKSSARKGKKEKQSLAKKLLHVVWKNMKKLFR